jgi:hypothetical protein
MDWTFWLLGVLALLGVGGLLLIAYEFAFGESGWDDHFDDWND